MTSGARRLAGLSSRVVLALALAAGALLAGAPPTGQVGAAAGAQGARQAEADVRIEVDVVAPRAPAPGGTLTLAGRVLNDSSEPLRDAAVRLRTTNVPLTSRGQLAMIATGALTRDGRPLARGRVDLREEVAPGGQRAFSVAVPLDSLGLRRFGVYPLTLELSGDLGRGARSLARERTFLPWSPAVKEYRELGVSWLLPVLDVPRRTGPEGSFRDDTLAQEIAGTGRLGRLVAAGARAPVTWVVDPDLLDAVADMADGYLVAAPEGLVQGTGQGAAAAWLSQLQAASADDEVVSLHYADVDVGGLVDAGLVGQVRAAADRGAGVSARVLGREVTTDVGWLAGGALDPAAMAAQWGVGMRAEIVAGALAPRPGESFTPTARTTLPAGEDGALAGLVADPALSDLAAGGGGASSPALAVQRFLAETAMIVAESPGRARTVLVAPPRGWNPDHDALAGMLLADAEAPWTAPTGIAALRSVEPAPPGRTSSGQAGSSGRDLEEVDDRDAGASLPVPYLRAVERVRVHAEHIASLLVDPAPDRRLAQELALRLSSVTWTDPAERAEVVAGVRDDLLALEGRVHIVPGGVTFGGRSGLLPITVVNERDKEVTVRVELKAASEKLAITASEPITVAPSSSGQVVFPSQARATGIVIVDAQLMTMTGAPYGPGVRKRVSITQYGTVGLLVTAGAALVLFGTATLRVVRRARAGGGRRGTRPGPGPGPRERPVPQAQPAEHG